MNCNVSDIKLKLLQDVNFNSCFSKCHKNNRLDLQWPATEQALSFQLSWSGKCVFCGAGIAASRQYSVLKVTVTYLTRVVWVLISWEMSLLPWEMSLLPYRFQTHL